MDNKPSFMDEKEFEGLNVVQEEVKEEPKIVEPVKEEIKEFNEPVLESKEEDISVETKDEEIKEEKEPALESKEEEIQIKDISVEPSEEKANKEEKYDIVKTKSEKSSEDTSKTKGSGFVMDTKLFATILCSIIVAYLFLSVARNLFVGFKYYDIAHGDTVTETQK